MPSTTHRELRIATLMAAPAIAAIASLSERNAQILHTTAPVLGMLWLCAAAALVVRAVQARRQSPADLRPPWHPLDVLTATGTAVLWISATALVGFAVTGWASLSVLGVLGLGAVFVAVLWTAIAAGGDASWRGATIARTIVPEISVEGDPLREQLRVAGIRIPAGMRLFATGRALPFGPVTRYAVGSEGSRAELCQTSELGAAVRGEHCAPPLVFWLGDVLGLTHAPAVEHGEARFSVLPRPAVVDGARAVLGAGGDDAPSRQTQRQPTEGTFRIRDYAAGDDTRRIHWVRSLQAHRLVVRLPDEIPQAEPAVRLILDTELWGAEAMACRAPGELLDALVRVWLGVARALTETGTRVTLIAAAGPTGGPAAVDWPTAPHSSREALRLGGRVAWQTTVPLGALIATDAAPAVRQVVVSSRPRTLVSSPEVAWIVVPEAAWTSAEPALPAPARIRLPFPSGSADNRLGRRRRARERSQEMRNDRTIFRHVMSCTDGTPLAGELLARPRRGRVALEVIP